MLVPCVVALESARVDESRKGCLSWVGSVCVQTHGCSRVSLRVHGCARRGLLLAVRNTGKRDPLKGGGMHKTTRQRNGRRRAAVEVQRRPVTCSRPGLLTFLAYANEGLEVCSVTFSNEGSKFPLYQRVPAWQRTAIRLGCHHVLDWSAHCLCCLSVWQNGSICVLQTWLRMFARIWMALSMLSFEVPKVFEKVKKNVRNSHKPRAV